MTEFSSARTRTVAGLMAGVFSALYFASGDVVPERRPAVAAPVAEAAIPVFVTGLCVVQRPRIGRLGAVGAAYASGSAFFTGTVLVTLVEDYGDWDSFSDELQPWLTRHGAVRVLAGQGLGWAGCCRAGRVSPDGRHRPGRRRPGPVRGRGTRGRRRATTDSPAGELHCCGPRSPSVAGTNGPPAVEPVVAPAGPVLSGPAPWRGRR